MDMKRLEKKGAYFKEERKKNASHRTFMNSDAREKKEKPTETKERASLLSKFTPRLLYVFRKQNTKTERSCFELDVHICTHAPERARSPLCRTAEHVVQITVILV